MNELKWIDAQEQLPGFFETVLVVVQNKYKTWMTFGHIDDFCTWHEETSDDIDTALDDGYNSVTHWMPLPDFPKTANTVRCFNQTLKEASK